MTKLQYHCLACKTNFTDIQEGEYYRCPNCNSLTYISKNDATTDNNNYFNQRYNDNDTEIPLRVKLFHKFCKINDYIFRKENKIFFNLYKKAENIIFNSSKVLEIGFGTGEKLAQYLKKGINVYGIDNSIAAVKNFKQRYPEFKMRVDNNYLADFNNFDTIYCDALFEHIDTPDIFLLDIKNKLKDNGKLIMTLPVIKNPEKEPIFDINMWKPVHRILYTDNLNGGGLEKILNANGFRICEFAQYEPFVYKVFKLMLKNGFDSVEYLRNPMLNIKDLNDFKFLILLLQSLFVHIQSSNSIVICEKYNS